MKKHKRNFFVLLWLLYLLGGMLWVGCSQDKEGGYVQEAWSLEGETPAAFPILPPTKNLFQEFGKREEGIEKILDILVRAEDSKPLTPGEQSKQKSSSYPDTSPQKNDGEEATEELEPDTSPQKNDEEETTEELEDEDNTLEEPPSPLNPFAGKLDIGNHNTCAIDGRGTLLCWGEPFAPIRREMPRDPSRKWTWVSLGPTDACAVDTEGLVECWGRKKQPVSSPTPSGFRTRKNCVRRGKARLCPNTRGKLPTLLGKSECGSLKKHTSCHQSTTDRIWRTSHVCYHPGRGTSLLG